MREYEKQLKLKEFLAEHEPYRETVGVFLDHGLNIAQTALALHVHRNTVTYRLAIIKQHTELDLHHISDAMLAQFVVNDMAISVGQVLSCMGLSSYVKLVVDSVSEGVQTVEDLLKRSDIGDLYVGENGISSVSEPDYKPGFDVVYTVLDAFRK